MSSGFVLIIASAQTKPVGDSPKLSGWQQAGGPPLNGTHTNIKPGTDDTTLIETTVEEHHHLASTMVVYYLKLINVTWRRSKKIEI